MPSLNCTVSKIIIVHTFPEGAHTIIGQLPIMFPLLANFKLLKFHCVKMIVLKFAQEVTEIGNFQNWPE